MRCCSCDQPLVGEEEGFCRPCLVVLPDIVQIPDGKLYPVCGRSGKQSEG